MITYTPQQLKTIKSAYETGLGVVPISVILGINEATLRRILSSLDVTAHTSGAVRAKDADARYLARMSLVKIRDKKEAAIVASVKGVK